jgi:glutaredoxin 3
MSPQPVKIYTSPWCGYCGRAKILLDRKGVTYQEIDIDSDLASRREMIARSGRRTVPQIFIGELHVGGADELVALERSGELDRLMSGSA